MYRLFQKKNCTNFVFYQRDQISFKLSQILTAFVETSQNGMFNL